MAIKFSQFVVETSASTLSHIVGYDGVDNIQITPNNFFTSFVTGTTGQVPFFGSTTSLLGDAEFNWDNINKRLGIGITSPQEKLHVYNVGVSRIEVEGSSGPTAFKATNTSGSYGWYIPGGDDSFRLFNFTTSSDLMTFTSAGNVGIGTTTPGTTLDVVGTLASSGITQLGTGGSNVLLTSASAGNVGIGSSSPSYKLDIYGDSSSGIVRVKNVANGRDTLRSENAAGIRTLNLGNDGSGNGIFIIRDSAGNVTNYITGSGDSYFNGGDVGIGTNNPSYKLHVAGKSYLSGGIQLNSGDEIDFGNTNQYITGVNNTSLTLATGGSPTLTATHSGNVGIGTTSPDSLLHVAADVSSANTGTITIEGRPTGFLGDDVATIDFQNNGSKRADIRMERGNTATDSQLVFSTSDAGTLNDALIIDEAGNVGIGTTSPSELLEVDGNIRLGDGSQRNIIGPTNENLGIFANPNGANEGIIFSTDNGSTTEMIIQNGGNVGIGTATPTATLHVSGSNADATDKPTMISESVFTVKPVALNSGNLNFAQVDGGNSIGMQYTNGNGTANWDISMQPFGGNVGIGTTAPDFLLDVSGSARININNDGTTDLSALVLKRTWSNPTATDRSHGVLFSDFNSSMATIYADRTNSAANYNSDLLFATNTGTNSLSLSTKMIIKNTGNVGIGTTSPSRPLHVNAGSLNFVAEFQSTDDKASILIQDDDTLNYIHSQDGYLSLGGQALLSASNLNIRSSDGNVGIGTTSPTSKLTVVGLAEHADNAAAISAGLTTGAFYRTGDLLKVVH